MSSMGICRYVYCLCIMYVFAYQVSGNQLQSEERYRRQSGNDARCNVFQAGFGEKVTNKTNKNKEIIYEFKYGLVNETTASRVTVTALAAFKDNPVLFVVRQQHGTMSLKVPFNIPEHTSTYNVVSRNLCPFPVTNKDSSAKDLSIFVNVYSFSNDYLDFSIHVDFVKNFSLRIDEIRNVNITPSEPQYFMYTFPDKVDSVLVHAKSDSDLCMIFSVQDVKCPVFDLEQSVEFSGIHQTMTKQAAITVKKSNYDQKSFYIVTVLKPSDFACNGKKTTQAPDYSRKKQLTLQVYVSGEMYFWPIFAALAVYILFYIVAIVKYIRNRKSCVCSCVEKVKQFCRNGSRAFNSEPQKNQNEFCCNLFIIAIFYGLPVVQLVMTYQTGLESSGDQDICYYNFECSRPLWVLSSFNNVFSNIGYILLGILFLLVVRKSDLGSKKRQGNLGEETENKDVLYAMGLGLVMEGLMSGCYHVCPSRSNFQFDTSFMYILTFLCMLRVSRCIHPNTGPTARNSYFVMAIVVFINVIGVLFGTNLFWILFGIVNILATLFLHFYVYYIGDNKPEKTCCSVLKKIYNCMRCKCDHTSKPKCVCRLAMLITATLLNWVVAICGLAFQPSDFTSFLLGIFLGNLVLYCGFYFILMKYMPGKKIAYSKIVCVVLAGIAWIAAILFFVAHLTSWGLTPAQSREGNKRCMLLDFYDAHDVWHFLSAIALFMSFLVLLTLNDDLDPTSDQSMGVLTRNDDPDPISDQSMSVLTRSDDPDPISDQSMSEQSQIDDIAPSSNERAILLLSVPSLD